MLWLNITVFCSFQNIEELISRAMPQKIRLTRELDIGPALGKMCSVELLICTAHISVRLNSEPDACDHCLLSRPV